MTSPAGQEGVRHPRRARQAARRVRPQHARPVVPDGPAARRGRRALRDHRPQQLGHARRQLRHAEAATAALARRRPLDAASRDLADRGLLDTTLVVVTGEFGRTPRINKNAGRDHWGPAFTVALGGGGIKGGRVVGKTDARAERPPPTRTAPKTCRRRSATCWASTPRTSSSRPKAGRSPSSTTAASSMICCEEELTTETQRTQRRQKRSEKAVCSLSSIYRSSGLNRSSVFLCVLCVLCGESLFAEPAGGVVHLPGGRPARHDGEGARRRPVPVQELLLRAARAGRRGEQATAEHANACGSRGRCCRCRIRSRRKIIRATWPAKFASPPMPRSGVRRGRLWTAEGAAGGLRSSSAICPKSSRTRSTAIRSRWT